MTSAVDRVAGAPISWGVRGPGWNSLPLEYVFGVELDDGVEAVVGSDLQDTTCIAEADRRLMQATS